MAAPRKKRRVTKIVKNCHMEGQWPYANCKPGGIATCYYIDVAASTGGSKPADRFILCVTGDKAVCCDRLRPRKRSTKR